MLRAIATAATLRSPRRDARVPRASVALAVVVVLGGAGLALLAGGRPWVTQRIAASPGSPSAHGDGPRRPRRCRALAIVAAAAAVVLLIGRRLVARLAGVLAALPVRGSSPRSSASSPTRAAPRRPPPGRDRARRSLPGAASPSAWVWRGPAGGLVAVAGGLLAAVARRQLAGAGPPVRDRRSSAAGRAAGRDPVAVWDA